MPKVVRELSPEDLRSRGQGQPKQELLEPYLHQLGPIEVGHGLEVELEENEDQRTVKRRFTMAGKQLGKAIKWRSSVKGHLKFSVETPKPTPPAGSSSEVAEGEKKSQKKGHPSPEAPAASHSA